MIRKLKFRGFSVKGEVVYGDYLTPWADDQHYPIIRDTADYKNGEIILVEPYRYGSQNKTA